MKIILKIVLIFIIENVVNDVENKNINNINIIVFFDIINEVDNIFIINVNENISIMMIMKKNNINNLKKVDLKIFL